MSIFALIFIYINPSIFLKQSNRSFLRELGVSNVSLFKGTGGGQYIKTVYKEYLITLEDKTLVDEFNITFSDEEKNAYKENKLTNSQKRLLKMNKNQNFGSSFRVVTSKDHLDKETELSLKSLESYETMKMGSSIKFCLLSEGRAEIYPRKRPTMEWDTAAGHAILSASGGTVIDTTTNKELIYGKKRYKNNSFVAYSSQKIKFISSNSL